MRARTVVIAVCSVAYVAASHWLMTRASASPWNALVIVGPMLALLGLHAWQRRQRALGAAATFGMAALALQAWLGGGASPASLYLLQHVAIHVALAILFSLTLRPGRVPLITALASRVHEHLTPDMAAYSRKVTVAWTLYFTAMAVLSMVIFGLAPFDAWATFANLGTPLAMAAMFFGEHMLRYRLHPEFERATIGAALRAYSRAAEAAATPLEHDRGG